MPASQRLGAVARDEVGGETRRTLPSLTSPPGPGALGWSRLGGRVDVGEHYLLAGRRHIESLGSQGAFVIELPPQRVTRALADLAR